MDNETEQMEEMEAEQQPTVGEILRRARLDKKISLTDVEKNTNIRAKYIEAVENGEYEKLPGDVFIRGIIRTYGTFLGFDGLELVNIYKASRDGLPSSEVRSRGIREVNRVRMNIQLKEKRDLGSGRGGFDLSLKQFAAGIIIILLLAAGYFAVPKLIAMSGETSSGPKTAAAVPPAVPAAKPADAAPAAKAADAANTAAAASGAEPAEKAAAAAETAGSNVTVAVECVDKCWIEVFADGEKIYENTLYAKDRKQFEAKEKLIIKYGNIGAMRINYNGEDVDLKGEQGVAVKTYLKK